MDVESTNAEEEERWLDAHLGPGRRPEVIPCCWWCGAEISPETPPGRVVVVDGIPQNFHGRCAVAAERDPLWVGRLRKLANGPLLTADCILIRRVTGEERGE